MGITKKIINKIEIMTPRKELFLAVKDALNGIEGIEYVDIFRKQFNYPNETVLNYWTSALIRFRSIEYETMTEQFLEGEVKLDVILYCKEGWIEQYNNELMEIDLLDAIAEKLQFLKGIQFKPIQLLREGIEDESWDNTEIKLTESVVAYHQLFSTTIYHQLKQRYQYQSLKNIN
ncbi:hypothetical protein ACFOWU_10095 [Epilithonimonas zeae]